MAWLQDVVDRRLSPDERVRYRAFRQEIAESWHPTTAGGRLLEFRARMVHTRTGLFGGESTMLQVALPAVLTALGFALRAIAPVAHDPAYASQVPRWVSLAVAAVLAGLAIEVVRSPRRVHTLRFVYLVALPLGFAALVRAALMHTTSWVNLPVRFASLFLGTAILLTLVAARGGRRRLYRLTVVLEVSGAAALVIAEAVRGVIFAADGDTMLVAASACIALGVALLGLTLYRSHPERRVAPASSPAAAS